MEYHFTVNHDMEKYFDQFLKRGWVPNWNAHPNEAELEMVLIEPRDHSNLAFVLSNMSCLVPNAQLTILHSPDNVDTLASLLKCDGDNNIRLVPYFTGNIDKTEYNGVLTDPVLWNEVFTAPKTLIFQTDSGMRHNSLLRFMQYDNIGAPWKWNTWETDTIRVGNGGFCLKTRKMMHAITKAVPYNATIDRAEDVYYALRTYCNDNANVPSIEEAANFSIEHYTCDNPMAFHQAWLYNPEEKVKQWMSENLDSTTPMKKIKIHDAWIESETGQVYSAKAENLVGWLQIGIGPNGLRIPEGTSISCITKDPFPYFRKFLNIHLTVHEGQETNELIYRIRLDKNRVLQDVLI